MIRPLTLTASLAALAALPMTAQAHTIAAAPSCTAATITGALFAPGANPVQVTVTTEAGEVVTTTVSVVNGVPVSVPYVLSPGAHQVRVILSWTLPDHRRSPFVAARASVVCPTPGPVPPVLEDSPVPAPPPATAPPVVAIAPPVKEGGVKQPSRGRLISSTSYRVIRAVACKRIGGRAHSVVRIRVVWKREGRVVKTRTAVVRRAGKVCRVPAVAG